MAAKHLKLQEIVSELTEVTEWHQLGVQLGVPAATLRTIESNYPHDAKRCKTEVLIWWCDNAPVISWEKLAQAVEAVGGHAAVAKKLKLKMSSTPKAAVWTDTSHPIFSIPPYSKEETGAVCSPHSPQKPPISCDGTLGEKDLLDITDYLLDMDKSHIYHLGLVLGLRQTKVKTLKDSDTFLDEVITAWLRKEDQVSEKGEPSWTVLVNALKHRRVGQTGIANNILFDRLG